MNNTFEIINNKKYKICDENKIRNPITKRCVSKTSSLGKKIIESIELNIICPDDKILNPKTNKCISKKNGLGKKLLNQMLGIKYKKIKKSYIKKKISSSKDKTSSSKDKTSYIKDKTSSSKDKSSSSKDKSSSSKDKTSSSKDKSSFSKNKALKIIQNKIKILLKKNYLTKRKIYYYKLIKKINNNLLFNNFCLSFYKLDVNNKPLFKINNTNIILKTIYNYNNVIYRGYLNENPNYFNFAVKLVYDTTTNNNDILLNKILNEAVLNDICPHFPLYFTEYKCNTIKPIKDNIKYYPSIITLNKFNNFILIIKELYNGNFFDFIKINYNNNKLLSNAISQIFMSILFFYNSTNSFHKNTNWSNFLFVKINSGGYFHYKILDKDYYIENIGYLWVINDFRSTIKFNNTNINIFYDFNKFNYGFLDKKYQFYNNIPLLKFFDKTIIEFHNTLLKYNNKFMFKLYSNDNLNLLIENIIYLLIKFNFIKSFITTNENILNKIPFTIQYFK